MLPLDCWHSPRFPLWLSGTAWNSTQHGTHRGITTIPHTMAHTTAFTMTHTTAHTLAHTMAHTTAWQTLLAL